MYSILTIHLLDIKFMLMLLSKNIFKKYIQQMICYITLKYSSIGDRNNVISPTEMYHNIFQKEKNYDIFWETIDKKGTTDEFYTHTYLTLTLFMILTLLESMSFVKAMVLKRDLSLLC